MQLYKTEVLQGDNPWQIAPYCILHTSGLEAKNCFHAQLN